MNAAYPVRLPLAAVDSRTDFGGAQVVDHVPVGSLTTLRVGPVARRVITCVTSEQIVETLRTLDRRPDGPVLVLGGGSNVVVADDLADLTVVRLANPNVSIEPPLLRAESGADWDAVVATSVAANLAGLECLSGIPGSVGATPVQNVGAYGVEVADVLTRVRLLDRHTFETRWVPAAELGFGYRHSVLKHSDDAVVLEVEFALDPSGRSAPLRYGELATALALAAHSRPDPSRVRAAVLALRAGKGMVLDAADHDTWSVGSFFLNPVLDAGAEVPAGAVTFDQPDGRVKVSAAWLIAAAGFERGFSLPGSGAAISTKHTLAFTNRGSASTDEVLALARAVQTGVRERFDIELELEPTLVGCAL